MGLLCQREFSSDHREEQKFDAALRLAAISASIRVARPNVSHERMRLIQKNRQPRSVEFWLEKAVTVESAKSDSVFEARDVTPAAHFMSIFVQIARSGTSGSRWFK